MSINQGLFSSARGDWRTPRDFYKALDAEFHFDFDPCPPKPTFDGLAIKWGQRNYVNPPYQRGVTELWIAKAWEQSLLGKLVVMLLPSRTDTRWWHDYVMKAREIRFIKGRLHFDERGPAPFPSAIVVFRG